MSAPKRYDPARIRERIKELSIEDAAFTSEQIARSVGCSVRDLIPILSSLRGTLPALPEMPSGRADVLRRIMERDVLSPVQRQRLDAFRRGEFAFPDRLELHLGPSCQCSCEFCFNFDSTRHKLRSYSRLESLDHLPGVDAQHRQRLLSKVDIRALLREFKLMGGHYLYLSGGLEFFTSRFAQPALEAAKQTGLRVHVYSNGVSPLFDDPGFVRLLVETAESIRFSLHASTPSTFRAVQMPSAPPQDAEYHFKAVRRHIENVLHERTSQKCRLRVGAAFLVVGINCHELLPAVDWLQQTGVDDCDIRVDMQQGVGAWLDTYEKTAVLLSVQRLCANSSPSSFAVNMRADLAPGSELRKLADRCWIPWKKPAVDPWGYVHACCYTAHPSFRGGPTVLGRFPEQCLAVILKDQFRRLFPMRHCARCTDWEIDYNRCVAKVVDDSAHGVKPNDLPF